MYMCSTVAWGTSGRSDADDKFPTFVCPTMFLPNLRLTAIARLTRINGVYKGAVNKAEKI